MRKSGIRSLIILLIVLASWPSRLAAERRNSLGGSISLTASGDDSPQVGRLRLASGDRLSLVYAAYPSVSFSSLGANSEFSLNYGFGYNHIGSPANVGFQSHTGSAALKARLSQKLGLTLSESFARSPDFRAAALFRGFILSSQGIFPYFETAIIPTNRYYNTAGLELNYDFSPRSSFSFAASHAIQRMAEPEVSRRVIRAPASDLEGYNARVSFQKSTGRGSWGMSYSGSQYTFREFQSARTHDATLDFSREITPTASMSLSFGPSYTEPLDGGARGFPGYSASFSISKSFEENVTGLSYSRSTGTTVGLGSISDTQRIGFNFSRPLGRKTTLATALSVYETRRRLDNPWEARGVSASSALSFMLTDRWAASIGGNYDVQDPGRLSGVEAEFLDVERKQVFISLSYALPEFWRF